MVKTRPPGTMAIISVLLVLVTISAGCMSETNPGRNVDAPEGEPVPASSTGFIQTPVTPGTSGTGDNDTGVSPLTTPNESNLGFVNIHPPIPDMMYDPFPGEDVSRPLYIPMTLPEGFIYKGGSYASTGRVWLRISNGTTDIIYTQAPESQDHGIPPAAGGVQVQQISAHNRNYTDTISGTQHQLSWNMEGLAFSLTGEPGPDELILIAGSVEPVTDQALRQIVYNGSG
jgi:hypothetical protein